ncbi:FliH/SctL family protein, partial [Roseateles sp.]|uniref:FliH/SctL family protein n=1 Tax=Roseateles sp. TaxID=1971397 RepID=UPI002F3FDEC0
AQCMDRLAAEAAELRAGALADATRIAIALNEAREQCLAAAETVLVEIAHQAARRLLLDMPAEQLARSSARLVRDEWRAMRVEGPTELRAHPDDLAFLKDIAADAGWSLSPDGQLGRGHCVLSHPAGSLHARYDDNVRALLKALPGARDPSTPVPPSTQDTPPPFLQETSA